MKLFSHPVSHEGDAPDCKEAEQTVAQPGQAV